MLLKYFKNLLIYCAHTQSLNKVSNILKNNKLLSPQNMTLKSKCACIGGCLTPILPHGMSVGSLFLLLLLIFICVYLTVGYLYRRFVIGARGIELLPHLSFWMDFPYLVQVHLYSLFHF